MLNEKGIYVSVAGLDKKEVQTVAEEVYDRLDRLGYAVSLTAPSGGGQVSSGRDKSIPPIYIRYLYPKLPANWPGM